MDADEREIYYFLKPRKQTFISAREICRHAGGKTKFKIEQDWAKPALGRMVERGILETDPAGHFRLKAPPNATVMQRWVSPQIATILRNRSSQLGQIVISEDDLDDYYDRL